LEATIKSQGNSLKVEQEENVKFRKEVDNLTLAIKEKESAMMSKQNAIEDLQSKAKQIKSLLEGATKKFAGGYDINKEELVKLLDNIIKGG
ncbi:MAG: hypothetical protein Q8P77_02380, partial [Candidatus Veblenbacteria bacterium]|nr:hypothetical protein [Candidatus Veblenbacteria bacterium]